MNFPEVAQSADEIARFHFRSFDIMPARDGILVQRFCHAVAPPSLHESGNDLDVENPARQKWCGEDLAYVLRRSEELGTALCVVNGQTEARRGEGGSDAAEGVPRGLTGGVGGPE